MNDSSEDENQSEKREEEKPYSAIDEEIRCGRLKESERHTVTRLMGPGDIIETFPDESVDVYSMDIRYVFLEGVEAQIWAHDDPSFVMELRAPDTRVTLLMDPSRKWTLRLPDRTALVGWIMDRHYLPPSATEEVMKDLTEGEKQMLDQWQRKWRPTTPGVKKEYSGE